MFSERAVPRSRIVWKGAQAETTVTGYDPARLKQNRAGFRVCWRAGGKLPLHWFEGKPCLELDVTFGIICRGRFFPSVLGTIVTYSQRENRRRIEALGAVRELPAASSMRIFR
jgi:hypothetical protein